MHNVFFVQYDCPEVKISPGLQLQFLTSAQGYIMQDIADSEFGLHGSSKIMFSFQTNKLGQIYEWYLD